MRRIVTTILFVLMCYAADAFDIKNIVVKNISTEHGLSHHSVNAIWQDEFGFMWIGTIDGLNRYDGHHFKIFKPNAELQGSITENNIRYICGDGDGHLYIKGLESLSEFDMRTQRFRLLADTGVKAAFYDGEKLWVSDTKTLSIYRREKDCFEEVFTLSEDMSPGVVIKGFTIGKGGKQYIFTVDDGVFIISDRGNIVRHLDIKNVSNLLEDRGGNLWISTLDKGVQVLLRDGSLQHMCFEGFSRSAVAFNNVRSMCEDQAGNLWLSSYGGLVKVEAKTMRMIHYRYEFLQDAFNIRSISPIFCDRQGALWLGSFHNGVSVYNPGTEKYTHYQAKRDMNGRLNSPLISSIVEDDRGHIFIGTEGGWVNMLDRKTGIFTQLPAPESLYDMTVKSLHYNCEEKVLYVSNLFGNITRIDMSKEDPVIFSEPKDVKNMTNIVAMKEYCRDSLLLATKEGMKVFDKGEGRISSMETGFRSNYVRQIWDIEVEDSGNIWFTTSSDLYFYDVKSKMTGRYVFSDIISGNINNHFNHILKDSKGRLWFGSSGSGFFLYDKTTDTFRQFGIKDGMPSGFVTAICEDSHNGIIYVSTNKGLVSYNPQTDNLRCYDASINFPITFIRNMFITKDSELFVCDLEGMISVSCEDLKDQPKDYEVFVSGLLVDNIPCVPNEDNSKSVLTQDIVFQKEVVLSPRHSSVGFEITSTDYQNVSNFVAEYMLRGFDNEFIRTSGQHRITYTNLSPGRYTFVVRGTNLDKNGKFPTSELTVVVEKPFYCRVWFIIAIAFGVGLIAIYLFRMYVLSVRLRSLNSANESKMRFFTNISHEFRTPLTLINGHLETLLQVDNLKPSVYSRILSIYKNSQTMNNLVNEIVDMMKSEAGKLTLNLGRHDIIAFMKEIYLTFDEYARQRSVEFSFDSNDKETIELVFDSRQLEKVFFNLLSNAFKYTSSDGHGKIRISLDKTFDGVEIRVKDNGVGIKPEHIDHIFELFYQDGKLNASQPGLGSGIGLSLSRAIIEMHGGSICVESNPGEGSCFIVVLKDNAVFTGEVINFEDEYYDKKGVISGDYVFCQHADCLDTSTAKGTRMLIVEDNEEIMGLLVSIFSSMYDIKTASCGEEGLSVARKDCPDIIVSDVMMPGMSGIEMCRILKENLETCHIPIVLLTAYALENYVIDGFSMGADDYVTKPFNAKILLARCDNLIRGRRRLQEKYQNNPETSVEILTTNTKDQTLLERAVDIVMANIDDPEFKIDTFAHELGLSRTYLFTKIKALTGQSPNEFISTIRLKEAATRLVSSKDESISEIAYSLGFSSSSYFINCFKSRYGLTPAQYRKEHLNK